MVNSLDAAASRLRRTRAEVVRQAVEYYLDDFEDIASSIEALRDPAADTDKNQAVSALEAFRYADRKTAAFYETEKRLASEHALLEDAGRGEGVRAPSPENGEGRLAAAFVLLRLGREQDAANDPAKQQLLAKKEELEQRIDRLKFEKAALPSEEYRKQLAALLLELARTEEALEK